MSSIYLLIENEQRGPYSEGQVRSMYLAGTITSEVHYWQEGQAEWLPIDELFNSQLEEASIPVPDIMPQQSPRLVGQSASPQVVESRIPKKQSYKMVFIIGAIIASIIVAFTLFHGRTLQGRYSHTFTDNLDNGNTIIITRTYDFNSDGSVNLHTTSNSGDLGGRVTTYDIGGNVVSVRWPAPDGVQTFTIQGDALVEDKTQDYFEKQ